MDNKDIDWIKQTILILIYNEATEILAIFTSISNKLKKVKSEPTLGTLST